MKKRYTFYLDIDRMDALHRISDKRGVPMSEIVNRLLKVYLDHEQRSPAPPTVPDTLHVAQ